VRDTVDRAIRRYDQECGDTRPAEDGVGCLPVGEEGGLFVPMAEVTFGYVDGDRAARLDSGRWIQADVVDVMEVR